MKFIIVLIVIFICSSDAGTLWNLVKDVGGKAFDTVNYVPDPLNPFHLVYTNSCIEDLGCFWTGPPFYHPVHRPVSLPPSKRVDSIHFLLYTPTNTMGEFHLQPEPGSVRHSGFDPSLETKILVHGYLEQLGEGDCRFFIKDAILKYGAYNVIIVDWTTLNLPPYIMAVANSRVVGAKIAKLIHCLMITTEATAESFHIIGHSLGCHVAGYAGERVQNMGRITGLDPAGPGFRGTEREVRLDPTDALFVDVIHTDGAEFVTAGLGATEPLGHMDFYPNGGNTQPGCVYTSKSENLFGTVINDTTQYLNTICDHDRANDYFLESIDDSQCEFLAVQCSSYKDYEEGLCHPEWSTLAEMGFHSAMVPGISQPAKFFLRTNANSPYCDMNSAFV